MRSMLSGKIHSDQNFVDDTLDQMPLDRSIVSANDVADSDNHYPNCDYPDVESGFVFKIPDANSEDFLCQTETEITTSYTTNEEIILDSNDTVFMGIPASIAAPQKVNFCELLGDPCEPFPVPPRDFTNTVPPPSLEGSSTDDNLSQEFDGFDILKDGKDSSDSRQFLVQCKRGLKDSTTALFLEHQHRLNKLRKKYSDPECLREFQKLDLLAEALHTKAELSDRIRDYIKRMTTNRKKCSKFQTEMDKDKKRNVRRVDQTFIQKPPKRQNKKTFAKEKPSKSRNPKTGRHFFMKTLSENIRKMMTKAKNSEEPN